MPKRGEGGAAKQGATNQAAYTLLRTLLDRQGMGLDDLIEGLEQQGYRYTKEAIRNWGKAPGSTPAKEGRRGFPRHAGLIPAIVRVLIEQHSPPAGMLVRNAACSTHDAVQFALLSEMPLAELDQLAALFPVEEFSSALVDHLARFAVPLRVAPAPGLEHAILRNADAQRRSLPVDHVPRYKPVPVSPALSYSSDFVGRQAELRSIAARLTDRAQRCAHTPPTLVITGGPGVGKSELARQFVARYGQFFRGGVFWISCTAPASIPSLIAACSLDRILHLPPTVGRLPTDSQVHLVQAAWHSPLPRLLVFDSCEDEEVLQRWRPASGGCWLVVTSRRAVWSALLELDTLALQVLDRASAIELLQPGATTAAPELDQIAAALGDLPLALRLAASSLAHGDGVLAARAYLAMLRATALRPAAGAASPTHQDVVAKSCAVSYLRLHASDPADAIAQDVLLCMGAFAPGEPIPRGLLIDAVMRLNRHYELPLLSERALRRLLELGLVDHSDQDTVRTHRLILGYLASQVQPDQQRAAYDAVAQALITLVGNLNGHGTVTLSLSLQPHLRWLIQTAGSAVSETIAQLHELLGHLLYLCEQHAEAYRLVQHALDLREQLHGAHDLRTSDALYVLALIEHAAGNLAQAQRLFGACLAIRAALAGPRAEITARTLNSLGHLMQQQGLYGQAHAHFVAALQIYRHEQAVHPAQYGRCLRNLAMLYLRRGYGRIAERVGRQGVALLAAHLPANHSAVAQATNHLGEILFARGAFDAAREQHSQALAMRRAWFGTEASIGVAESFYNLGRVLMVQQQYADAESYLNQALAIAAAVNQLWNMPACMFRERLGCVELLLGKLDGAKAHFAQARAICSHLADSEHPQAAAITDHEGVVALLENDWAAAAAQFDAAWRVRSQSLGRHHPATAQSLVHLALVCDHEGDHVHACQLLHQAAQIFRRRLGAGHPLTTGVAEMIAACTAGRSWIAQVLQALSYE